MIDDEGRRVTHQRPSSESSRHEGEEEEDPFWQIALNEEYNYECMARGFIIIDDNGDDNDDSSKCTNSNNGDNDDIDDHDEQRKSSQNGGGGEGTRNRRRVRNHHHCNSGGKVMKYRLPTNNATVDGGIRTSSIVLELVPLPPLDGIWTPVGADAWYSSALLASMILQHIPTKGGNDNADHDGGNNNNNNNINDNTEWSILPIPSSTTDNNKNKDNTTCHKNQQRPFRVLELGSGAMGLSGLSCAAALSLLPDDYPSWTVYLTDNEPDILRQLKINVKSNMSRLTMTTPTHPSGDDENVNNDGGESVCTADVTSDHDITNRNKKILVEPLDWSDDNVDNMEKHPPPSSSSPSTTENGDKSSILSSPVDLVIGSELVYTSETAYALIKVLLRLLKNNPLIQIWIVQVIDRYGWSEIVIPGLESVGDEVHIQSIPISWHVHEMASSMIPMGGTLDRHAYGAFCITNKVSCHQ